MKTVLVAAMLLAAAPAVAQYNQYTEPGELPFPELPTKDRLELALSQARWDVGPLRLDPWVGLYDVAWMSNVYGTAAGDPVDDFTATLGLGLHGYSHAGSDVIIALHALPEYVWWKELADRRGWFGSYGVGAFGFFNRLRFETSATTSRQMRYLSSEVEQPVDVGRDGLAAGVEVALPKRFAVFGSGDLVQWRYREHGVGGNLGAQLILLDRDEDHFRFGVRYSFSDHVRLGLGAEVDAVDFLSPTRDRSSSGTSPMVELELDGRHLDLHVLVIAADLTPEPGSEFQAYNEPIGNIELRWKPKSKLEWQLYARSNLVYSLIDESPYYTDRRLGLAALMPLGYRAAGRVFAERGHNEYAPYSDGSVRDDDIASYGAMFTLSLTKHLVLKAGASRTQTDRGSGLGSRTVTRILAGVTIGESTSEWW